MTADDAALRRLACPWRGSGYLHVPPEAVDACLARRDLGSETAGRWNRDGQRTLYLAGDPAVALSEYARHLQDGARADTFGSEVRELLRVEVQADALVDLRDPVAAAAAGVEGAPEAFRDPSIARAAADRLRAIDGVAGFLAPPLAFLDDPRRWNAVLFLDRPEGSDAVRRVDRRGCFRVEAYGWGSE